MLKALKPLVRDGGNHLVSLICRLPLVGAFLAHVIFDLGTWTLVGITAVILVCGMIIAAAFPTRTATLVLTTTGGEVQARTSTDIPGVERVKRAIEQSFGIKG